MQRSMGCMLELCVGGALLDGCTVRNEEDVNDKEGEQVGGMRGRRNNDMVNNTVEGSFRHYIQASYVG